MQGFKKSPILSLRKYITSCILGKQHRTSILQPKRNPGFSLRLEWCTCCQFTTGGALSVTFLLPLGEYIISFPSKWAEWESICHTGGHIRTHTCANIHPSCWRGITMGQEKRMSQWEGRTWRWEEEDSWGTMRGVEQEIYAQRQIKDAGEDKMANKQRTGQCQKIQLNAERYSNSQINKAGDNMKGNSGRVCEREIERVRDWKVRETERKAADDSWSSGCLTSAWGFDEGCQPLCSSPASSAASLTWTPTPQ